MKKSQLKKYIKRYTWAKQEVHWGPVSHQSCGTMLDILNPNYFPEYFPEYFFNNIIKSNFQFYKLLTVLRSNFKFAKIEKTIWAIKKVPELVWWAI